VIVIADTSPQNYLVLLDAIELLPRLYTRVVVPKAVLTELRDLQSPTVVLDWCANLPAWVEVRSPRTIATEVAGLGYGEREAISLAMQTKTSLLLIDERKGTDRARALGLETIGLLGVLVEFSEHHIADGHQIFQNLLKTSFLIAPNLREQIEKKFQMLRSGQ
jgi:predicted nucleic acid-binding protein